MVFAWWVPVAFAVAVSPVDDVGVPMPQPQIFDGAPTTTCQWPTAAMLGFGGCSATLVSPWMVITAAHCVGNVENPGSIELGESFGSPARELPVDYCRRGPDWDPNSNNGVGGSDIAYCKLVSPVYDFPVTPIVFGCETEILTIGREVWIVGIGANAMNGSGFGTKRMGPSVIAFVDDDILDNGIGIGDTVHSACPGDSGGPAYVQYPDGSWHVFGVTSGGPEGCGNFPLSYTAMHPWVPWIEEDSGVDITPCHDVDGTWNPTGNCQGFEMDPFDDGNWDEMCLGEVSPPSGTCGDAFDAVPDTEAPTVTITAPANETIYDTAPASVNLSFTADDGDGWGVRFVRVSINGDVQDAELREPPFELSAQFPQGGYEIVAIAEDFAGNLGESEVLRIAVDAELPPPPEDPTSTGPADTGPVDTTDAESSGPPAESSSEDEGSTTAVPAQHEDDGGCGCTTDRSPRGALWLGVFALALRRRQTSPRQAMRAATRIRSR
jgi:MYXO-CTERM domain-containing protein